MKMGENGCEEEEWMLSDLVENEKVTENEEEEEEVSLCDLPNKEEKQSKKESPGACSESQEEDFDFCWWGGSSLKESEMCAADEVFFQGQILPFRHSISSDGGSFAGIVKNNGAGCGVPRLEPSSSVDDRCHSFRYTSGSSRSSSIRSLRSTSSGSSSTSTTITTTIRSKHYNNNSKKQPNIRSQSTPQVRLSKVVSHANVNNNGSRKSSTLWSLFRVGLVSTPEIDFHDLKIRQHYSRNSTKNSDVSNRVSVKKNLKQRLFPDKNMILFGSACSCSVNDVQTVPPRTATVGRNSSAKERHEDDKNSSETTKVMRKQAMSRRLRTFEWLKQLSVEGSTATTL